jgi:hypothetical protein
MQRTVSYQANSVEDVAAHLEIMATALEHVPLGLAHVRGMEEKKASAADEEHRARTQVCCKGSTCHHAHIS